MKQIIAITIASTFLLGTCSGGGEQPAAVNADAKPSWEEYAATVIAQYYERNPETAIDAGLHEYDGQMSDYSLAALDEKMDWLDSVIATAATY